MIARLQAALGTDEVTFHPGVQYRHIVVAPKDWADAECVPPHDLSDKPVVLPTGPAAPKPTGAPTPVPATSLTDPVKKEYAQELVSSAENSTLNWRGQFGYIEDIGDGRGYTGGIIGFCSGTHDMLELVREYTKREPDNILAKYLPALEDVRSQLAALFGVNGAATITETSAAKSTHPSATHATWFRLAQATSASSADLTRAWPLPS